MVASPGSSSCRTNAWPPHRQSLSLLMEGVPVVALDQVWASLDEMAVCVDRACLRLWGCAIMNNTRYLHYLRIILAHTGCHIPNSKSIQSVCPADPLTSPSTEGGEGATGGDGRGSDSCIRWPGSRRIAKGASRAEGDGWSDCLMSLDYGRHYAGIAF